MRLQNAFSAVGTTGLDSQVLTVLSRVTTPLTIAEVHRLLPEDGSEPGVRLATARLVEQGVVSELIVGRTRGYLLNEEHLLAEAIRLIGRTKARLVSRIADEVGRWSAPPLNVTLFGSAARGDMRTDSDVDVLTVVDDEFDVRLYEAGVSRLAHSIRRWTGNDAGILPYVASEVEPAPIFTSILAEGIHVYGDPAWLRRQVKRTGLRP